MASFLGSAASGASRPGFFAEAPGNATFDFAAFINEVDREREAQGLRWYELAHVLWNQSAGLNDQLGDAPI